MKTTDDLELRSDPLASRLSAWMNSTAPNREPAGLVDAAVDRTRSIGQRPAFLVRSGVREPGFAMPGLSARAQLVLVAVLLIVAAIVAAAIGAGMFPPSQPEPSRTSALPMVAMFVRQGSGLGGSDIEVTATRADGSSRIVARFSQSVLPKEWIYDGGGRLSIDGLLAVPGHSDLDGDEWALFDLSLPDRAPFLVPTNHGPTSGWSSTGLFATGVGLPNGTVQLFDGRTGAVTDLGSLSLPGGGPNIIWAADGSGIVVGREPDLALKPIDGGSLRQPIPAVTAYRWLAGGQKLLYLCEGSSSPCRGEAPVLVHDGHTDVAWYDGNSFGTPTSAAFAADGMSLWLLFVRPASAPDSAVIVRALAPGQTTVAAAIVLDPRVTNVSLSFADDDSVLVLSTGTIASDEYTPGTTFIVSMASGRAATVQGDVVGFVPAALAESWPTR